MEINPDDLTSNQMYKIIIGTIVPRPIAWVSTVNETGRPNLAPFSFFTAVCDKPPHLLFCSGYRGADGAPKDTLRNVRATGEFVINIVTEALAAAMNVTATELPAAIDEFEYAGVTPAPARTVRPPRVAESPVNYECEVTQIVDIGDWPGAGAVVIGRVKHVRVSDAILQPNFRIDIPGLQPVGRLAGSGYTRVTDMFDLVRPPSQIRRQEG